LFRSEGGVGRGLRDQVEPVAVVAGQGQAQVAAADAGHEVDDLGRDLLGGAHEVAFVLSLLVVNEHDHAAGPQFVQNFRDRRQRHGAVV
jgi:hypothetical protein